jgi:AcrR family transcriptional regulator
MSRPRSDNKRDRILSAAIRVFAERGLSAPTSAISKAAEVAEGTLFTYFETKDDLVNALYREIKLELAGVMMSDFARKKDVRSKLRHIWNAYVNWGVAQPDRRRLLAYLKVSDRLTEETKAVGYAPFAEIQVMAREAIAQNLFKDLPLEFITEAMEALAQTTMELMASYSSKAGKYRAFGFEMLWNGITRS